MSRTVCVKTFSNRWEAEFARSLLESEGIRSIVSADDCGGWRPDLALATGGVRLLVLEENAKRAIEVLEREAEEQ